MYLAFILIQQIVYTTCIFVSDIPWASIDREISYVRIVWKLLISFGFMFDKFGNTRQEIDLVCGLIGLYIIWRRVSVGVIYHRGIYYLRTLTEFLQVWL